MGAANFEVDATGETVGAAFSAAVDSAAWEHGHGGYTGTIAEKHDFVLFEVPEASGLTPREVVNLVAGAWCHPENHTVLTEVFGEDEACRLIEVYEDKWGPAAAVANGPRAWIFFGHASS